nr:phosphorylase b kinase gamma catalytic chain, skeletal muscle/heart isoform [Halyomorpha halys]
MTKEEIEDTLPDKDAAKEFYAKYEPKEILGRGVSSTVRRCIEKETGLEFAAKIIDISVDADLLAATREEMRILKLVAGHPYIIQLHDVFESSTFIFLVFELCPNGELFDYLTTVVTLSEKKTRCIMRQLLEAIQYVHSKRIVHRDLKPENILLDESNNIKVTDFGFAHVLEENQELTELCGTPGYLAPEVLKANMFSDAKGYGLEVDIWACGVIMYTLLVGCPPFWHRKQIVMLRNIMEGKYSFTSPEWADISQEAKDLIAKLLVVDPTKRLSVKEALSHPFFNVILWDQEVIPLKHSLAPYSKRLSIISQIAYENKTCFDARKKFKYSILCILAMVRFNRLIYIPKPISVAASIQDPYKIKTLRKVIDNCAFRIYGHWVKKGEGQNRAALFEMNPKTELRALYMSNISA